MPFQESESRCVKRKNSASQDSTLQSNTNLEDSSFLEDFQTAFLRVLGAFTYIIMVCLLSLVLCGYYLFLWAPHIGIQKPNYQESSDEDRGGITQGGKRG